MPALPVPAPAATQTAFPTTATSFSPPAKECGLSGGRFVDACEGSVAVGDPGCAVAGCQTDGPSLDAEVCCCGNEALRGVDCRDGGGVRVEDPHRPCSDRNVDRIGRLGRRFRGDRQVHGLTSAAVESEDGRCGAADRPDSAVSDRDSVERRVQVDPARVSRPGVQPREPVRAVGRPDGSEAGCALVASSDSRLRSYGQVAWRDTSAPHRPVRRVDLRDQPARPVENPSGSLPYGEVAGKPVVPSFAYRRVLLRRPRRCPSRRFRPTRGPAANRRPRRAPESECRCGS